MMTPMASSHNEPTQRGKNLKVARLATWLCPLGLNVFLVWFASSAQDFIARPGAGSAIACLQALGGVLYFAGAWYQALGTIRNKGVQKSSLLISISFLLSSIGLAFSAHAR
jgi:hypothetical protein